MGRSNFVKKKVIRDENTAQIQKGEENPSLEHRLSNYKRLGKFFPDCVARGQAMMCGHVVGSVGDLLLDPAVQAALDG
jgi:hypothetical protein